jgi:DNA transposition AAA+ family ATPase
MNIRERITTFLSMSGWSVNRLAKTAGVDQSSLSKFLRDPDRGLNSRTIERLWATMDAPAQPQEAPNV